MLSAVNVILVNGYQSNLDEAATGEFRVVFEPHFVVSVCVEVQASVERHFNAVLQQPTVLRDRVVVHQTIEILRLKRGCIRLRLARKRVFAGDVVEHSHG